MASHDTFVLGASAGGVEALRTVVSALPADLPASLFVVLHVSPRAPSMLPEILSRSGALPAAHPRDREAIERGRIYVAPPDHHLLVKAGHVRVVRGPAENRHRPSVDVLFRSAAEARGPRVTGIVLSGTLDDGTAGLVAIKIAGGVAIVQDPAEAFSPGMPASALKYVRADHVLPVTEIGPRMARLALATAPAEAVPIPDEMAKEAKIAELDMATVESDDKPGVPSAFTCPDCSGTLWEIQEGDILRFRCRVGHSYATESMDEAQGDALDRALWTALRALEERSALARRVARHARERKLDGLAIPFENRVRAIEAEAKVLRDALLTPSGK